MYISGIASDQWVVGVSVNLNFDAAPGITIRYEGLWFKCVQYLSVPICGYHHTDWLNVCRVTAVLSMLSGTIAIGLAIGHVTVTRMKKDAIYIASIVLTFVSVECMKNCIIGFASNYDSLVPSGSPSWGFALPVVGLAMYSVAGILQIVSRHEARSEGTANAEV